MGKAMNGFKMHDNRLLPASLSAWQLRPETVLTGGAPIRFGATGRWPSVTGRKLRIWLALYVNDRGRVFFV